MKYTSLKNDIVNILHSSDYNLYLKFYDTDGKNTLNTDDAEWCYISNHNIMFKFMDDENPNIEIWKDNETLSDDLKHIIQRIRELSVLNGVEVQIRVYNDLNQRKIYNLIKNNIMNKKESEEMNESKNISNELVETLYGIVQTAKTTKRPSDFYLSEEMQLENFHKLGLGIIEEISHFNKFKNTNLKEHLSKLLSCQNIFEAKSVINKIPNIKVLEENIQNIKNITNFVKNEYLYNGALITSKPRTILVLENVKVYMAKEKNNRENLINAFNELLNYTNNAKTGTDILREIKKHNICETYNVSKKELLNMFLNQADIKKIPLKQVFVIENYKGEKSLFNEKYAYGIKALAHHLNNDGENNDSVAKNIMEETIKYNQISDFINTYKYDLKVRKIIPQFKSIFQESINKLSLKQPFDKNLFESVDENIDYTAQYNKICNELGVEHPAIKYLALENAKEDLLYCSILMENITNDENILVNGLKPYIKNPYTLNNVVKTIMDNQINLNETFNSASELYNKICLSENFVLMPISSALFNIIHTKKLTENKQKFVDVLLKYIK